MKEGIGGKTDTEIIIRNQIAIVNMLGFIINELKGQPPTLEVKLDDNEYVLTTPDIEAISFQEEN
jgi:hypothetical protein